MANTNIGKVEYEKNYITMYNYSYFVRVVQL